MSREKFEVFCNYEDYSQTLNVYIFVDNPDGSRSLMTSLDKGEVRTYNRGECIEKPTFKIEGGLSKPFLQAFANELHKMGIKAEEAPVLENELTAIKYHLEDMRAMAFNDENLITNRRKKDEEEERKG